MKENVTTTTTEASPITAFDKLMEAINNGGMTMEKKHDVLMALANYVVSR
jgi:hypothetical protein